MKRKLPTLLAVLCTLLLTACIPTEYTPEQEAKIKEQGEALIREYLDANFSEYHITRVSVLDGIPLGSDMLNMGQYISNVVSATFIVNGQTYTICEDILTKEVSTSIHYEENVEVIEDMLQKQFAENGISDTMLLSHISVKNFATSQDCPTKNGKLIETHVEMNAVFPENIDKTNVEAYLTSPDGNHAGINVTLYTAEEDEFLTLDTWKGIADQFSWVDEIKVWNLAEEDFAAFAESGELPPAAKTRLKGTYELGSTLYDYSRYTSKIVLGIGVNAPTYTLISVASDDGEDPFFSKHEQQYSNTIVLDGNLLTVKIGKNYSGYIFFTDETGWDYRTAYMNIYRNGGAYEKMLFCQLEDGIYTANRDGDQTLNSVGGERVYMITK